VDEVVISHVYRGKVACGESDTWDGVPLTVPPLPPTSKPENFCKLMEIEYHLDVSISAVLEDENEWHLIPVSLVTLPYKPFVFWILSLDTFLPHIISSPYSEFQLYHSPYTIFVMINSVVKLLGLCVKYYTQTQDFRKVTQIC
jgi:hypothetical protein